MKYLYRILSFILLVIWACNIFRFSGEDADTSTDTGNDVAIVIIKIFCPEYDTLEDAKKEELLIAATPYVRSGAHFFEYAVLGFIAALCLTTFHLKKQTKLIFSELFSALFALSDEIYQLSSPGRTFQLSDVLTDSLGAATGLIIFLLIVHPKVKYDK